MSKSDKKNAEYAAHAEANLSRLYQNYLDRLNEKTGRQITKGRFGHPGEKRPTRARMEDSQLGGKDPIPSLRPTGTEKASSLRRNGKSEVLDRPTPTTNRFQTDCPRSLQTTDGPATRQSILTIISALCAILNPFVLHKGWAGIQASSGDSKEKFDRESTQQHFSVRPSRESDRHHPLSRTCPRAATGTGTPVLPPCRAHW